ncbi:hypothetical protein ABLE91_12750 [Aquabacter sp. CN5-332]|uniref:hypothetical protein n=1 Tax=Aquabacter sp. CN5-332 TaxID=3156608 RepID=UPI0032B32526
MTTPLKCALQILAEPPSLQRPAPAGVLQRQVWKGGVTNRETRRVESTPPRYLFLADLSCGALEAGAQTHSPPLHDWLLEQIEPSGEQATNAAGGVILVSMDVDPAQEDEFNEWYNTEHFPIFRRVPGVIQARRFRALRGAPRYVALYHVESLDVYRRPDWMAANETPWILRLRRYQRNRTYFMFSEATQAD